MDNAVALAALSLAGTLAVGFFKLLNKLSKSIDENTKSNKQIAVKTEMVAKKTELVAKATTKGNEEAKQRNGHLAELVIQQADKMADIADAATKKVIETVQHVEHQRVEHQIISDVEVKEVNHVPNRDKTSK